MTRYLAGLLVFSGVGSFLITDTLNFLRLSDCASRARLRDRSILDFLRLILLTVMVVIGYNVASATFNKSEDLLIFLAVGIIGAFLIHILTVRFHRQ